MKTSFFYEKKYHTIFYLFIMKNIILYFYFNMFLLGFAYRSFEVVNPSCQC